MTAVANQGAALTPAFATDGFQAIHAVLAAEDCAVLAEAAAASLDRPGHPAAAAGSRNLLQQQWCRDLVARLRQHAELAAHLPADYLAVQGTYFEKSAQRNWLVPIHQDLSIPVAAKVDHENLSGWSDKQGTLFVQPPVEVLERLIAVRLHLDPCLAQDGPLQVIPGSHLRGRFDAQAAAEARRTGPVVTCSAAAGDVLLIRPLLLHASSRSSGTSMRRVLHLVFAPPGLPFGLRWPQQSSTASR